MNSIETSTTGLDRRFGVFEDRYGAGAHERLLAMLNQPCVSFAEIATRFGVTRERVRQWQLELLPDAPRGHARRRLCGVHQQKRRLLADPLFRAFYRHARAHFAASRFVLIQGRDGFRRRSVKLDGSVIALREGRPIPGGPEHPRLGWALTNSAKRADFIYYRLDDEGYLFVPRGVIPRTGATMLETRASQYLPYRNSFAAALTDIQNEQRAS